LQTLFSYELIADFFKLNIFEKQDLKKRDEQQYYDINHVDFSHYHHHSDRSVVLYCCDGQEAVFRYIKFVIAIFHTKQDVNWIGNVIVDFSQKKCFMNKRNC